MCGVHALRVFAVLLAATACGGAKAAAPPPTPVTLADAKSCRVTKPEPAPRDVSAELATVEMANGNGELWAVGLPPAGLMEIESVSVAKDGSLYTKLAWWRRVKGELHVSGERLDAPAAPLRADVPAGYPETGFLPTGLTFPSEGCWKVTGRIGNGRPLSFVAFVVRSS
jgi:hypothetical protein